jgi:hypothetical protein
MSAAVTSQVHSHASINVRALVLPRAKWETARNAKGQLALMPRKNTWYGHIVRYQHSMTVVPMIGCPACGGILAIPHSQDAALELQKMTGMPVPVAHRIDHLGKVSPDIRCQHGKCGFHRRVYLDRWNKTKTLYAIAYVNEDVGEHGAIEIAYSHSIDTREARMHLGKGNFRTIAAGPAVGVFVDERTGRVTAD